MMMEHCTICTGDASGELSCSRCEYPCHYTCALGFEPPDEFKNSPHKHKFLCPPCVVGKSHNLLHVALNAHEKNFTRKPTGGDPPPTGGAPPPTGGEPPPTGGDPPLNAANLSARDQRAAARERRVSARAENHTEPVTSGAPKLSDLSDTDLSRAAKPKYMISRLRNLPDHTNIVLFGDSNTHKIHGRRVDPEGQSVAIRSSGGLCIPAFVHALKENNDPCPRVKKLYLSLGTNDSLHSGEHCLEDWPHHIKSLQVECLRVFPRARLHFILPFKGLSGVPNSFIKVLEGLLREHCPKFQRLHPPSMINKVDNGGVHINPEGKTAYITFLQKVLVGKRPSTNTQGPTKNKPPKVKESFRVRSAPAEVVSSHPAGTRNVAKKGVSRARGSRGNNQDPTGFQHLWGSLVMPPLLRRQPQTMYPPAAAEPRFYPSFPGYPSFFRGMDAAKKLHLLSQSQPWDYIYDDNF